MVLSLTSAVPAPFTVRPEFAALADQALNLHMCAARSDDMRVARQDAPMYQTAQAALREAVALYLDLPSHHPHVTRVREALCDESGEGVAHFAAAVQDEIIGQGVRDLERKIDIAHAPVDFSFSGGYRVDWNDKELAMTVRIDLKAYARGDSNGLQVGVRADSYEIGDGANGEAVWRLMPLGRPERFFPTAPRNSDDFWAGTLLLIALMAGYIADECGVRYAPEYGFICTLPAGHQGVHEDATTDAPATVAWSADGEPVMSDTDWDRALSHRPTVYRAPAVNVSAPPVDPKIDTAYRY